MFEIKYGNLCTLFLCAEQKEIRAIINSMIRAPLSLSDCVPVPLIRECKYKGCFCGCLCLLYIF